MPSDCAELGPLVEAASTAKTMMDISAHPGLFGGFMRGTDGLLMTCGGSDILNSPDEDGAANLIHAHLIETLCAIGREWLDFYFLRVRRPLEEFQITGALRALEWAREEGHVKSVGLSAEAEPVVVASAWQFHDGFEGLLLPSAESKFDSLRSMANVRRVGVVSRAEVGHELNQTSLVSVRSAAQANAALEAAHAQI